MKKTIFSLLCGMLIAPIATQAQDAGLPENVTPHLHGKLKQRMLKKLDKNADGKISKEEFSSRVSENKEKRQAKLKERFHQADANSDGVVTEQEFLTQVERHMQESLNQRFDQIDVNNNGYIDQSERKAIYKQRRHFRGKPHPAGHLEE